MYRIAQCYTKNKQQFNFDSTIMPRKDAGATAISLNDLQMRVFTVIACADLNSATHSLPSAYKS